jgi:hypothetical protein
MEDTVEQLRPEQVVHLFGTSCGSGRHANIIARFN